MENESKTGWETRVKQFEGERVRQMTGKRCEETGRETDREI